MASPKMTKKHFEMVARCISNVENVVKRTNLAHECADEFEKANSQFDRSRFLAACDVSQPVLPTVGNEES